MITDGGARFYDVSCDDCGDGESVEAKSFRAAVAQIKETGWRVFMWGGAWQHTCPSCNAPDEPGAAFVDG